MLFPDFQQRTSLSISAARKNLKTFEEISQKGYVINIKNDNTCELVLAKSSKSDFKRKY